MGLEDIEKSVAVLEKNIQGKGEATPPAEVASNVTPESATETNTPAESPLVSEGTENNLEQAEGTTTEEKKYEPNYKFKVYDKELEFDDWIKPLVNKDNESQMRELMEKAHGLPLVKEKLDKVRNESASHYNENQFIKGSLQKVSEAIKTNDVENFCYHMGIDKNTIKQMAVKILQYEEMPQDQRQMYDNHLSASRQNMDLQNNMMQMQQRYDEMIGNNFRQHLTSIVTQPEINNKMTQINNILKPIYGHDNGFLDEVKIIGKTYFDAHGGKEEMPLEQAIDTVIKKFSHAFAAPKSMTAKPQAANGREPEVIVKTRQDDKTLPNVGRGTSASATKPKIKSMDDLKKLSKELAKAHPEAVYVA